MVSLSFLLCGPVAERGLRRRLCKCSASVCISGGFTWLLVTLPLASSCLFSCCQHFLYPFHLDFSCPSSLPPRSLPSSFLPLPCIPAVMGLTDTRHQQVLWPRWIRFPTCRRIVLPVHFRGLVLHSWRLSVQKWCAAMSNNHYGRHNLCGHLNTNSSGFSQYPHW